MQLTSKCAAALVLLLCLWVSGCSSSRDAASSNAPALLSSAPSPSPSPQSANTQPESVNAEPKAESPLPPPTGFVNDYAHVFDGESKERLESALKELRDKSGVAFSVVTVETTGGQPIFDYSLAVAKGWGVGPKDASKGGGLLLLLATKDRKWHLQVSRGLEKDLPNEVTRGLADESVKLYRDGKYAEGITRYAGALVAKLEEARGFRLSNELSDKR
jgi:uncharacterized membrane protein YgcG